MTNLIVNGDFPGTSTEPWVFSTSVQGTPSVVNGALEFKNKLSFSCTASQTFTTTVAGAYVVTCRLKGSTSKFWHVRILPELDELRSTEQDVWGSFSFTVNLPAAVTRTLVFEHGDSYETAGYVDDVTVEFLGEPGNLLINGQFSSATLAPWTYTGPGNATVSGGYLHINPVPSSTYDACLLQQVVPITETTDAYRLTFRARCAGSAFKTIRIVDPSGNLHSVQVNTAWTSYQVTFPAPATAQQDYALTFQVGIAPEVSFDDIALVHTGLTFAIGVTSAGLPSEPMGLSIIGTDPGQVVVIVRQDAEGRQVTIAARATADPTGSLSYQDYLYRLGDTVTYIVYNSDRSVELGRTLALSTPDALVPWISDVFLPELLATPTAIVDITARVRASRVTVYRVVSQRLPVTLGDIRQASDGTMTLFCRDHAERDQVIATLSSGFPCSLRVPASCRPVIDDMIFTPLDITEQRFGTNGACTLEVDFVESSAEELPQFVAVTYAAQTTNADSLSMTYTKLATNFVGYTYAHLYLSPDGVNPA